MEQSKFLPKHLLLVAFPAIAAFIGGAITSDSLASFMTVSGSKGISTAQFYLGISIVVGLLAFGWKCLSGTYMAALALFVSLISSVAMRSVLGFKSSLFLLFFLNLSLAVILALVIRLTFHIGLMLRIRTAAFAAIGALANTGYLIVLNKLISHSAMQYSFSATYMSSLFMFIFIGFGLSVANIIIVKQEVDALRKEQQRLDEEEDDI